MQKAIKSAAARLKNWPDVLSNLSEWGVFFADLVEWEEVEPSDSEVDTSEWQSSESSY